VTDHNDHRDEIGAYLLGALTDDERRAFERHMDGCADCRDEVEQLRAAADALPRSVEQLEPPPGLKTSLMEVVERESRERSDAPVRARRPLGERLRRLLGPVRPVVVAGVLALGLLVGFGVAQLTGGGDDMRTLQAQSRLPGGSATLQVQNGGRDGAILRVEGMPSPGAGRVYQAWVQRGMTVSPEPTFEVRSDGAGAVAVPDDLSGAQAVLVTRERRGGASSPSERPVLSVAL
jgi:anti-sigma factor RsiW